MSITNKQLQEALASGMTQGQISVKYGVSRSAISQRIKRMNTTTGGRSTPAGRSGEERPSIKPSKDSPSMAVLGVSGGSRTFGGSKDNETYNPDDIAIDTYRKMGFDAQLNAALYLVKLPIQNAEWTIKTKNAEVADFVKTNFDKWWDLFMTTALTALDFGFAAFEKRWAYVDGKYVYKHPLDLLPESITILQNKRTGAFEGVKQKLSYVQNDEVTIPAPKSFVFTNKLGESFGNLYGISRLKAAYRFWYAARYNYDFANTFFETFSSPFIKGFAPKGSTDIRNSAGVKTGEVNNIDAMLEIIKNLRMRSAAALPWTTDKRWDIEFMEAKRTGGDFVEYIRYLDLMKLRAVFVPDLVMGQGGERGSYALGKVHMRTFLRSTDGVLNSLKFHIDKYLIPQLVEYNFAGYNEPVEWIFEPPSKEDRETLETIFVDLIKQGRVDPDHIEIAERLGVPMDPEGELRPPQPKIERIPDENHNATTDKKKEDADEDDDKKEDEEEE